MNAYKKNPGDLQVLAKYVEFLDKYSEAMEKLEELEKEDMSLEESAYFLEVTSRIEKKLLEVAK